MNYLSPVINHVHNNLNAHLTLKLHGGRYSLPAKETTKLDFDIMSLACGSERSDLFNAIVSKYITVDVLVLKDGEYTKVGEYCAEEAGKAIRKAVKTPVKTVDTVKIAEKMGITVDKQEPVKRETVKAESITKVTPVTEEAPLDPIKEISTPKKSEEPALKNVKKNQDKEDK